MEIEIKLGPAEPALAAVIFDDITLLPPAGAEERIRMHTIYYDDPSGSFRAEKQTLRLRQENDLSVCTFKTALEGLARLELDCEAPDIVSGAAQLLLQTGTHPSVLKDAVCSPGGSTIAGVHSLEDNNFQRIVSDAIGAAYRRNIELGK